MVGDQVTAAYRCGGCDVEGTDPELGPFLVNCWNCGHPAAVTARMVSTAREAA